MSDYEFDFFAEQPSKKEQNLQQVMQQLEQGSIDFDQFDEVPPNNDNSLHSDLFQTQRQQAAPQPQPQPQQPSSEGKRRSDEPRRNSELDASRNIAEISYMNSQNSFRFEEEPPANREQQEGSGRYARLQQMLSKAKNNSLDDFYKNLDNTQAYRVEQKFRDKAEFKYYSRELKAYKRERQQEFEQDKGSYKFIRDNKYPAPQFQQQPSYNFAKKEAMGDPFAQSAAPNNPFLESKGDPFASKNYVQESQPIRKSSGDPFSAAVTDNPFSDIRRSGSSNHYHPPENDKGGELAFQPEDGFDFPEIGQHEAEKQKEAYEQKQYEQQADEFFKIDDPKPVKKEKKVRQLEPIREEHPQVNRLTEEEVKMGRLMNNYEQMKGKFSSLMGRLKDNNSDQERIISQLKNLKSQYKSKEDSKQREEKDRDMKRQAKEADRQAKQRKMSEIKDEIKKMKEGEEKDVIYLQINEKIEKLQEVVKNAIVDINQDREDKFVPKIINYYSGKEGEMEMQPQQSRKRSEVGLSRSEHDPFNHSESHVEEGPQEQVMGNVKRAMQEMHEDRSQQLFHVDEFTSPLQLDLTTQQFPMSLSRNRSQQLQQPFVPPHNAQEYSPNTLDTTNRHLRRCLTQKSSVLFESFEFYVTGRFTISGEAGGTYPVICEVRVANKCAVALADVFVVVYGPQAQESELQVRPNRLVYDEFKSNSSQFFEVDLSKSCLDSGYFNIQISYKSEGLRKKKVNFRAILPFIQLIKPQFVYEEQLLSAWNHMESEWFVRPKPLDYRSIRSHQDLKLILPFIEINENDPNAFAYGLLFTYPKSTSSFMLKVVCYVSGKASLHLKSTHGQADRKLRQEVLDVMNFLCFT